LKHITLQTRLNQYVTNMFETDTLQAHSKHIMLQMRLKHERYVTNRYVTNRFETNTLQTCSKHKPLRTGSKHEPLRTCSEQDTLQAHSKHIMLQICSKHERYVTNRFETNTLQTCSKHCVTNVFKT
jgi:hypothetical protein